VDPYLSILNGDGRRLIRPLPMGDTKLEFTRLHEGGTRFGGPI
jgi:hypothetical protein